MGYVTEQGQHGQQTPGENDPGENDPGSQLQPHQPTPPAQQPQPIDTDTYRQFQQFQEFQQFQRFQELQHSGEYSPIPQQPPGRRIRAPRWLRWLAKKLLTWLIFAVLTILALYLLFDYMFGTDKADQSPAADDGGGTYHDTVLLKTKPYEAVRSVYDAIAQGKTQHFSCGRFKGDARQTFARNLGYPNCAQAAQQLHDRVDDANDYAESIPSSPSKPIKGETVTISSCDFDITGGPALGTFTLTEIEHGQWIITGHEKGPERCPETSVTGTAPTR